jgi:hypothetical protein
MEVSTMKRWYVVLRGPYGMFLHEIAGPFEAQWDAWDWVLRAAGAEPRGHYYDVFGRRARELELVRDPRGFLTLKD